MNQDYLIYSPKLHPRKCQIQCAHRARQVKETSGNPESTPHVKEGQRYSRVPFPPHVTSTCDSHSNTYELHLYISLRFWFVLINDTRHFFFSYLLVNLKILLENDYLGSLSIYNWVIRLLPAGSLEFLVYFTHSSFGMNDTWIVHRWSAKIFFSSAGCLHSIDCFLCCANSCQFGEIPLVCLHSSQLCFWDLAKKNISLTRVKTLLCIFF